MITVPVQQLQFGQKLAEDVFTEKGSLLFCKGITVSEREIEILNAFFVREVSVEEAQAAPMAETGKTGGTGGTAPGFRVAYDRMIRLIKQLFDLADTGRALPILEIRKCIENGISHIDEYNVLSFVPPRYDVRDYIYHNSAMVSMTSYLLAKWCGFDRRDLIPIAMAGYLHDLGMAKVDGNVVDKKGKLLPGEWNEVKKHTAFGYSILKDVPILHEGVRRAAFQHHEREDGSGYPLGTKGDQIHPYAKIVAVTDMFHAMTSKRPYRENESPYLVLEELFAYSFGKLEPAYVQTFIRKVSQFHNGTMVKLNDDSVGEIVFTDANQPTRPWVSVNGKIINLAVDRRYYIKGILPQ